MTTSPPCLRLASRRSPLAWRQADCVAAALRQHWHGTVELVGVSTRGDEILDQPLAAIGGKALFIKGLQAAIADGRADAAVHSLKDMEAQGSPGFTLAAVGFAADRRDAVISRDGADLARLPAGATVGTCSPRRTALLKHYFPQLTVKPLRGNIQTRLAKLAAGELDALLLAAAGLARLQMEARISAYLPLTQFIPAVGQGLLGLECAADNSALIELLAAAGDEALRQRAIAERAFAAAMEGDCHTALGAHATLDNEQLTLQAFYAPEAGGFYTASATAADAAAAGQAAAADIQNQVADAAR